MENLLSRLARNPYAPIDGASVTRVDELGNGYDDWNNLIAPKYTAPEQTWGETALGVATAPARIATALAGSLSPYGQDGWQVPPIVSEGADALTAVGDAYTGKMAPEDINSRALGMAGFMMGGGGLAARPAGGTGMFAGRLAKTADHEALARAERMAAEGADRNAIWNETGWFQGPDSKWRFEIDDSQANMQKSMSDVVQASSEPPPFSSVFRHDELIGAYPDAADVMFLANQGYKPGTGAMGRFSNPSPYEGKDVFVAGYNAKDIGSSDVGAMRLMPHEMQHFIQSQEGFARGGSPSEVSPQEIAMERARQASIPSRNSWTEIDTTNPENPDSFFAHKFYNRLAGEVEARNAQKRHDMTADERRATPPWETQDIPDADQIVRLYSNADSRPAIAGALDMSQEARLARARDMGFDTDRVLYHGTGKDFQEFEPGTRGNGTRRNVYLTDNPDIADIYANSQNYGLKGGGDPMIYPLYAKAEKPLVVSDKGPDGSFGWVSDNLAAALGVDHPPAGKYATLYDEARRQGYDQVQIREMTDLGGPQTQYIPLKPEYIRSVNAAFDPAKSDSANLLAANADSRPALLAGALGQEQDIPDWLLPFLGK